MCFQCFPFFSRSSASLPSSPRPSQPTSNPNSSSCAESVPLLQPCPGATIVASLESEAKQQGSYAPPSEVVTEISEKVKIVATESQGLSDGYETHPSEECDASVQSSSTSQTMPSQVYQFEQVEHTSSMTISHTEGNKEDELDQSYDIPSSPSSSTDQTPSSQLEDESLAIEEVKPPQYGDPFNLSSSSKYAHKRRYRIGQHLHDLQQHVKQEGHRHLHSLYNGAKQQVSDIRASLSSPRE